MYILRVCKFHGYPLNHLTKLFESLILSLFTYAIEVWGSVLWKNIFGTSYYRYGLGYTGTKYNISSIIEQRNRVLFSTISSDEEHVLYELFPEKKEKILRKREHNFIHPRVKTERFKRSFVNTRLS